MEFNLNNKKTSSQDLFACGNGGGLHDKLLLKSKGPKASSSLQTKRVPRSSGELQNFLPQMAQANEKLKLQMEQAPEGHYDIERVEESGKVIEMGVSLVELSSSDSDSDKESSQDNDANSDSEEERAHRGEPQTAWQLPEAEKEGSYPSPGETSGLCCYRPLKRLLGQLQCGILTCVGNTNQLTWDQFSFSKPFS